MNILELNDYKENAIILTNYGGICINGNTKNVISIINDIKNGVLSINKSSSSSSKKIPKSINIEHIKFELLEYPEFEKGKVIKNHKRQIQ